MVLLLAGDGVQERISAAAWPLVVAAAMTALGALASITSGSAARRLNPGMATLADLAMVDAHMDVELAAYDAPDFTERSEAAETDPPGPPCCCRTPSASPAA